MLSLIRSKIKFNLFALVFIFTILSCTKEKATPEVKLKAYTGPLKFTFVQGSIEKIFSPEKPWELKMLNYYNILKKDSKWYMWYNSLGKGERAFNGSFCFANSTNGKNWERVFKNDSTNILISGKQSSGVNETFVFHDETDVANPFKMICTKLVNGGQKTFIYSSSDGIDWKISRELYDMLQDTQFSVVNSKGDYYIFSRYNEFSNGYQRAIGLSVINREMKDIQRPRLLLRADPNDPYKHIYNSAASKVDSAVLLFPTYYNGSTNGIQLKLILTMNLKDYYLISDNIYADLFPDQNAKWAIVSPGLVPTGEDKNTYWLYYYGSPHKHDDFMYLSTIDVSYYRIKLRIHL
jgi:hypothetical protein